MVTNKKVYLPLRPPRTRKTPKTKDVLRDLTVRGPFWHRPNALDDYTKRKDICLDFLTRLYYNDARQFAFLKQGVPALLKKSRHAEWALACAGYVAYLQEEYGAASRWFLRCVEANPANLDNWMDLAFALRHTGEAATSNGILFYFDYVIHYARTFGLAGRGLPSLKALVAKIVRASEKKR